MFYFSKIAWTIVQPSSLIALMLAAGAVAIATSRHRVGLRLLIAGAALYLFCGYSPIANWLLIPLELRAASAPANSLEGASGIIVLGGAVQSGAEIARGETQLNEAAERMTEAVRLAAKYPALPVVFTGGKASLIPYEGEKTEAELARSFFEGFNLAPPRLRLEDRARNTLENAILTAQLLRPTQKQSWILITSAFHMPRAKALFEAQGFKVLAWPVDFRTFGAPDRWSFFLQPSDGLRRLDLAAKEWAGLCVSWLRGDIAWPRARA